MSDDPFRHVPELRDHVTPHAQSFFRDNFTARARQLGKEHGLDTSNIYPDDVREGLHTDFLKHHSGDLWVFAYGSLIWDPALDFTELRRARITGLTRRMCLLDVMGARGTPEVPGAMAGLTEGSHCDGMAFLLPEDRVFSETSILWQRECIAPGYLPRMVAADTPQGPIDVLAFVADNAVDVIRPGLTIEEQATLVARGEGVLGTSFDYVHAIIERFELLDIVDEELQAVYDRAVELRGA